MKKKGKSTFSKIIAWLHLWPSIVAGLILVFVSLTGTIIVYGDEIMQWSAGKEALYVKPEGKPLKIDEITSIHKEKFPGESFSYIIVDKDPTKSWIINSANLKNRKLTLIYINPYTGEILKQDKTIGFFYIMAHVHSNLLMGKTGGWIVAISTIVFVLSTLTGLVLWWPKKWTKATRDSSFKIKWKARFKRLNYDLHNVFGFYSAIICFLLGMTGLLIFFSPLMKGTISLFGGEGKMWFYTLQDYPRDQEATKDMAYYDTNELIQKAFDLHPDKKIIRIWTYNYDNVSIYPFFLGTNAGLKSEEGKEALYFDKFTGQIVNDGHKQKIYDKVDNLVWQIHMGQWWGQLGKFSTFLAGLIATTLPITGFLVWWGRRKKKSKTKN
ncbi:PepSY-associated TM helix domain-containing protein [Myroides marinus]|uniref:Uncharacterized iron-regulated membrane protein n=1 Tax=Myroides marinus TaxID=703342 RepID=A0A1H6YNR5_9FLAO|nr:PepSY-associated TM helix domain-containing protein [Myroides marinus]MDM1377911.1 PepSY domain-containing protein [Myroides marinus]MDM1383408.1 PepSY domain-containing protein [Myroides marinus]MDM1385182.1 PepSY domain-containing protein [Myroides marinus]MDM1392395.1 PepSY domain-containing protein [Myroides marinus]MDM1405677.1 PepSY domain-containing protein [Myroides marinus]